MSWPCRSQGASPRLPGSRQGTSKGFDAGPADNSTAILESGGSPSACLRAMAEVLASPGVTAKTDLDTDLPTFMVRLQSSAARSRSWALGPASTS